MKNKFILPLLFLSFISLSACTKEKDDSRLPTTNYEKVKFAFDGVEKSLKEKEVYIYNEPEDNLNWFGPHGVPTYLTQQDDYNLDFDYNDSTLIQFQYLKALYDEIGKDLIFGTKYEYNINGSIYYDFDKGEEIKEEKYLNQYSLDLSFEINIDDEDEITSSINFDLKYNNNGIIRNQNRYLEIELSYSMDIISPCFELSIYDINDLLSNDDDKEKYINCYYNFFDVSHNEIVNWNRYGISSPEEYYKYINYENEYDKCINDNYIYKYSNIDMYSPNIYRKLENKFNKDEDLLKDFYADAGYYKEPIMYISREIFKGKDGIENDKILTVKNILDESYGKDIINALVYTGEKEKWEDEAREEIKEDTYLECVSNAGYTIDKDVKIKDLFDPNVGFSDDENKKYLTINLKNNNGDILKSYNNLDDFDIYLRTKSYDNSNWIGMYNEERCFVSYADLSGFIGDYNCDDKYIELEFDIRLKSNSNIKLNSNFSIKLYDDEAYDYLIQNSYSLFEYISLNTHFDYLIPEFGYRYDYVIYYSPEIINADKGLINLYSEEDLSNELEEYASYLDNKGFTHEINSNIYEKRINYFMVLKITINKNYDNRNEASISFEYIDDKEY